jgi:RIO kinase 1
VADGVIDEVIGRLKTGKEAEVWLVRRGEEIVAAKVYHDREHRSFRQNAAYKEGRQIRNSRTQRAMEKGSRFGKEASDDAWKSAEADALYKLHRLGVRVPQPVMFYEGVLLMEVVIDAQGHPAPRLIDASIPRETAAAMYRDLRQEVIKMLSADLIHGDLSPFNVLLGWNGPILIDFPQVISASHNSRSESFLKRDVENLRTFFAGLDPSLRELDGDGDEIWRAYVRRELTSDFVPTGRPRPAAHERHGGKPPSGQGRAAAGGRGHPARIPPRAHAQGRRPEARHPKSAMPVVTYRGPPPGPQPQSAGPARAPAVGEHRSAPGTPAGSAQQPLDANRPRRRRRRRR